MPLVPMKDMLIAAKRGRYAVGQFNINGFQWAQAILEAAEEEGAPVIVAASDRLVDYLGGFRTIAAVIREWADALSITVPVALHLDHGRCVERCRQAIDAGFTSVMFDGSHEPIEDNINQTRQVVDYARRYLVSVEGEIGTVGGIEDGLVGGISYADPDECVRLVEEGGIDALAAALGSVHGPYQGRPKLGFDEMRKIARLTGVPLVLHGGSGIPNDQIQKVITYGHAKINVNTECVQAWARAVRQVLNQDDRLYDPQMILTAGKDAVRKKVKEKIRQFRAVRKV
ncbi:class II fructose-1,6-bisphosphate aldolase [Sporolactobacillus sp. THM7-7]|nr:class II fructose-1,6-bisphosphate aldolase [Sporolactobacillus sp. THM7-7]